MESCGTAHYRGRRAQARGLRVRLLPVSYVRPYVRRNQTDRTDSEALLEAARCGEIHPVPVTDRRAANRAGLTPHSDQWQTARVAQINTLRGLLREHGHSIPVGARTVLRRVTAILEDAATELPDVLRHTLALVVEEVRGARGADRRRRPPAGADRRRPPRGEPTANHSWGRCPDGDRVIGAVGHIHAFRRGREFASWLGLTPRESSTGGRRYLGRIGKRGDVDLQSLLAHGARAVLRTALRRAPDQLTRLHEWAVTTAARRGRNKATIAVANKLARIVWAVWRTDDVFHARPRLTEAALGVFLPDKVRSEEDTHGITGRTGTESSR